MILGPPGPNPLSLEPHRVWNPPVRAPRSHNPKATDHFPRVEPLGDAAAEGDTMVCDFGAEPKSGKRLDVHDPKL